ncbi:MAG: hypothetical protein AAGF60_02450 [Pseudomonadota bacterium]
MISDVARMLGLHHLASAFGLGARPGVWEVFGLYHSGEVRALQPVRAPVRAAPPWERRHD